MALSPEDIEQLIVRVARALTQENAQQHTPRKLDERNFKRVDSFSGEQFRDWCFTFKFLLRSVAPKLIPILEWVETHGEEIDKRDVARQFGGEVDA